MHVLTVFGRIRIIVDDQSAPVGDALPEPAEPLFVAERAGWLTSLASTKAANSHLVVISFESFREGRENGRRFLVVSRCRTAGDFPVSGEDSM